MQTNELVAFDLKAARKKQNLSQIQVAAILCVTQPTISRWEEEGKTPAIYRKAWEQHWLLEGLKDGKDKSAESKVQKAAETDREVRGRNSTRPRERRMRSAGRTGNRAGVDASTVESRATHTLDGRARGLNNAMRTSDGKNIVSNLSPGNKRKGRGSRRRVDSAQLVSSSGAQAARPYDSEGDDESDSEAID